MTGRDQRDSGATSCGDKEVSLVIHWKLRSVYVLALVLGAIAAVGGGFGWLDPLFSS